MGVGPRLGARLPVCRSLQKDSSNGSGPPRKDFSPLCLYKDSDINNKFCNVTEGEIIKVKGK